MRRGPFQRSFFTFGISLSHASSALGRCHYCSRPLAFLAVLATQRQATSQDAEAHSDAWRSAAAAGVVRNLLPTRHGRRSSDVHIVGSWTPSLVGAPVQDSFGRGHDGQPARPGRAVELLLDSHVTQKTLGQRS